MIRDLEYIVNVVVIVDTPTEKEARQYVERHLRGNYTKDYRITQVEYKDGRP
jgi:hypothetical protein